MIDDCLSSVFLFASGSNRSLSICIFLSTALVTNTKMQIKIAVENYTSLLRTSITTNKETDKLKSRHIVQYIYYNPIMFSRKFGFLDTRVGVAAIA